MGNYKQCSHCGAKGFSSICPNCGTSAYTYLIDDNFSDDFSANRDYIQISDNSFDGFDGGDFGGGGFSDDW